MYPNEDEIENFLSELKEKIKVFGMIIIDRDKNRKTLSELEISQSDCQKYISKLEVENYCKGPVKDTQNEGHYWEFGTEIKNREVYIKINYGNPNKAVICISFHIAEHKLKYRFKK